MATIPEFYHQAVLEGRGLNPIFLVNPNDLKSSDLLVWGIGS